MRIGVIGQVRIGLVHKILIRLGAVDGSIVKLPGPGASPTMVRVKGAARWNESVNSYGSGSTSKIPKPPRNRVFPLRGFQANPNRGSKFRSVGFENNGPVPEQPGAMTPQTGCAEGVPVRPRLGMAVVRPCDSVGTVVISYRKPALSVNVFFALMSSSTNAPKRLSPHADIQRQRCARSRK